MENGKSDVESQMSKVKGRKSKVESQRSKVGCGMWEALNPKPKLLNPIYKSCPQYDKLKLLLQIGKSEISLFLTERANAIQL